MYSQTYCLIENAYTSWFFSLIYSQKYCLIESDYISLLFHLYIPKTIANWKRIYKWTFPFSLINSQNELPNSSLPFVSWFFLFSCPLQFPVLAFSFPFHFLSFLSFSFLLPILFPSFSLLLPFLSFPFLSLPFLSFPVLSSSMSHFEKVVFALGIHEFSLPANETSFSHVSLAGSENSWILSAKTTFSKWLIGKLYVPQNDVASKRCLKQVWNRLNGFKWCLDGWWVDGWMDGWMLSKCCFPKFQSGFKVVSNTCSGALSILGFGKWLGH